MWSPAKIAVTYLVVAVAWIGLTEPFAAAFPDAFPTVALLKGWVFVVLSAALIYVVLRREWHRRDCLEDVLRVQRQRFRAMFDTHDAVMLLVEPESGAIVDANKAAARFYRYPLGQLRRMNIEEINCLDAEQVKEERRKALEESRNYFLFRHRVGTGEIRDVEVHSSAIRINGQQLLFSIVHDVTERKRAEEALRASEKQDRLRARIFELMAGGGSLKDILLLIVRMVEAACANSLVSLLLVDEERRHLVVGAAPNLPEAFVRTLDGWPIAEGEGCCGSAAFRNQRVSIDDLRAHPQGDKCRALVDLAAVAACSAIPLRSQQGAVLGVLCVHWQSADASRATDLRTLESLADLASLAVEHSRIEAELRLASSVYQASGEAIVVTDAANHIIAVNPAFTRLTGYAPAEVIGRNPQMLSAGHTPPAVYRAMWHAIETTGQWQGEVHNRRKDGEEYVEWLTINALRDEGRQIYRYVGMFSDITEKKRTEEVIWRQANFDSLTGLPNRRLFRDRLGQELKKAHRANRSVALLFIDLDRFKEVNDTLGHKIGDELLLEAAHRISACVRESDTVARLGGDEFTVILTNLADPGRAEQVAQAIVATLHQPFKLGRNIIHVSGSVGITLYPLDAQDIETLLRNADQAMYVAKDSGRNRFSYFTESMQRAAQERMLLSNELHGAMAAGQFEVYFQPIVDLATMRIARAEALLRWCHPELGMIGPQRVIALAEEAGLIGEIGDWVFRQAAQMAKRWLTARQLECGQQGERSANLPPVQVSVNVSPRQFFAGSGQEGWISFLREIGLPPQCIVIEITERLFLDERPEVAEKLNQFREAGIEVSLDDFGTGYAALSHLRKFSVDCVKIDQSFIQDMTTNHDNRAVAEAIVAMAHSLGLRVVAEGVEHEEQRKLLLAVGCDEGQGFLFGTPMTAEDFYATVGSPPAPGGADAVIDRVGGDTPSAG